MILALDIGSSSIRASLFDHAARPVHDTSIKFEREFSATADGGAELDAGEALSQVAAVVDAILEKTKSLAVRITHIASCAFWHSLMGVDADGTPSTSVFGWADRRSRNYSALLKTHFDEAEIHNRTGAHFHSSFWPAKLLRLRTEFPDVFARTAKWLSFSDYVALTFCGVAATSVSMASATGIFDQRNCDWDGELLGYLGISREHLPKLGDRTLRSNAKHAERWPQLKDAEWFTAIGDGAADHVGSCGIGKGKASLMVGTSAAMRVAYTAEPPPAIPQGLWSYRIDRGRVIVGGALSDGGNLYQKIKAEYNVSSDAENEMRRRGAAAHGLTVLPFFFGERSTGYNEDARGEIIGLNASNDGTDILQAVLEGVAYRLSEISDRLKAVVEFEHIVASGGALRDSPVWTQIIADVLGRDQVLSNTPESSSRGAVLLALESIGRIDGIDGSQTTDERTLGFHPECHDAYKRARKQHQNAYEREAKKS